MGEEEEARDEAEDAQHHRRDAQQPVQRLPRAHVRRAASAAAPRRRAGAAAEAGRRGSRGRAGGGGHVEDSVEFDDAQELPHAPPSAPRFPASPLLALAQTQSQRGSALLRSP